MSDSWSDAAQKIKKGGVGILPTDTLYGIVCSAFNNATIERVYDLKKRGKDKACIILISSPDDLKKFNIEVDDDLRNKIAEYWPGPYSVILPCEDDNLAYLHRGLKSLAFRLPNDEELRHFLQETGPIIAPSANPETFPPAMNIEQAQKYFGDKVDFYIDRGVLNGSASTIIDFTNGDKRIR